MVSQSLIPFVNEILQKDFINIFLCGHVIVFDITNFKVDISFLEVVSENFSIVLIWYSLSNRKKRFDRGPILRYSVVNSVKYLLSYWILCDETPNGVCSSGSHGIW
jgi:hypothetical protein